MLGHILHLVKEVADIGLRGGLGLPLQPVVLWVLSSMCVRGPAWHRQVAPVLGRRLEWSSWRINHGLGKVATLAQKTQVVWEVAFWHDLEDWFVPRDGRLALIFQQCGLTEPLCEIRGDCPRGDHQ